MTREQFDEQIRRLDQADTASRLQSDSIAWLARTQAETLCADSKSQSATGEGPLVSIIMPCWNRCGVISNAINSIRSQCYQRWELLIVDDGSMDNIDAVIEEYASDSRIRYLRQDHLGVTFARNHGLSESVGEIVAYLDSDNRWYSHYLRNVVQAFESHPEHECVYLAQLFHDRSLNRFWIQAIEYDQDSFLREGGIDMNTFAHRRGVYEREGGFDQDLHRLSDWELIGRYTRNRTPLSVPHISGIYYVAEPDSISASEDFAQNAKLVQQKLLSLVSKPIRSSPAAGGAPELQETCVQ